MKDFAAVPAGERLKGNDLMGDMASGDAQLQTTVLDAVSDALSAALIIYDKNDEMIYASRLVRNYYPVPQNYLLPGTRLREFLGAVYDAGGRHDCSPAKVKGSGGREEWIAEHIAAHWRERSDFQERDAGNRWTKYSKRRLPSGYGLCVITDITEQKKREEQWRADVERVQLTEEILDNLPHPIYVQDRDLTLVAVNKAFCAMMATGAEGVLGRNVKDVFDTQLSACLDAAGRHVLETGTPSAISANISCPARGEMPVLVRSRRVGKPGRYFVVTSLDDPAEIALDGEANGAAETRAEPAPRIALAESFMGDVHVDDRLPEVADIAGRKILLVTTDDDFEAKSLKTLAKLGVEACSVHDADEEEAFLSVARSEGVAIDLVVVDTQMELKCLELAELYGVDALTLDNFQLDTELAFRVAQHLSGLEHSRSEADDWEITTGDDGIMPKIGGADPVVLVAEDNEINQIVFSQILDGLGFRYRIASTGEEAVRLWQELRPQIVLMDITLPDMNGFEVCRRIRELERTCGCETPVIGVLVHAFERDREDCVAAGMNDVVLKPLSPDIIEGVFQRFIPGYVALSLG